MSNPTWPKSLQFAKSTHAVCSSRLYREPYVVLRDKAITKEPSEQTEMSEEKHQVHLAVSNLPEVERLVTRMAYFENFGEEDISACLAMRPSKVRRALERARQMLKARLA